ncbi:YdcF family protein [Fibrella forsythiae]|uniref:YdcF family protein n=1 Tax=Fibrella forsythiae TaxID=2817061 RepID=A0ABS3JFW5_9BACT|nr:YdcF family protein [Fibrella forsythiae]MBO0948885.1 YdcF family protein [Fibrella forsythiae]
MFYFLSKTAGYFLTPAGWLLAALAGALLFPRFRKRLLVVSLGVFWLLGNSFLVNELARVWELNGCVPPMPRALNDTSATVAVVLTGGLTNSQLPVTPARPMLSTQADRLGQALYLYKTGRVQKILISGGSTDLFFMNTEALHEGLEGMRFLHLAGIPARDLIWETHSRNTYENAQFSAKVLRSRFHTDRCVLVTSAFHLRRAMGCFTRAGIQATPFPAAYIHKRRTFALVNLLVPHEDDFSDAMHLIREVFGYVTYRVAGYI